ncbi:hypothetical protein CROQUDRAFT_724134 [Cronartium quercuum f. sp. fusiforme G11]|uniref:Major facilitator superfamily (MFS) profile domain-containing protein n=1 Tax=Cronartium quercuum f. sp. fusiforme G11 TaxID=708437 RepID=A0A9P6TB38_9BASI|nr:hypothetical protein CROQUDRAFT_724134 [Cronartium quercuum f. sp. fusiforme G11]
MSIDLFLFGIIVPVMPFVMKDRLHLPEEEVQSATSNLLAAHAIATFFSAPLVGIAVDGPLSRKTPFLFGLFVLLSATTLLCFGRTFAVLMLARLLQGASAAIVWIVGLAMVTDITKPENLGKALGGVYSITTIGSLISPTIGGLAYTKFGYYAVYLLAGSLLLVDIVLRLLVIEKDSLSDFDTQSTESSGWSSSTSESSPLLINSPEGIAHRLNEDELMGEEIPAKPRHQPPPVELGILQRHFPLLLIINDPRLLAAIFVTFTHACLVGTFNATIPIHVQRTFQMSSLDAGLLFIAIEVPYMIVGPLVGHWLDRSGPRTCTTMGAILLVPALFFLRYPHRESDSSRNTWQVSIYAFLLVLNGIGLSATSASAFVQANNVGREYHRNKPGMFGKKGPYGQLYALNNVMYSLGMTLGPLISGGLTSLIGYGNSMAVIAFQAALTALAAFLWMDSRNMVFQ